MYDDAYKSNQPHQPYQYQYNDAAPPYYGEPSGGVQDVNAIKPTEKPTTGWRDVPFAVLFLVNVVVIAGLMGVWGIKGVQEQSEMSDIVTTNDAKTTVGICIGMGVGALALSLLMVQLIVRFASCIIRFMLWFNVAVLIGMAIMGFKLGGIVYGVLCSLCALLAIWYALSITHRIPFAVANLKVASAAIKKHWSAHVVAFGIAIVQLLWVVMWVIALVGVVAQVTKKTNTSNGTATVNSKCRSNSDCESNYCRLQANTDFSSGTCQSSLLASPANYGVCVAMLLSFYWALQVFKNIAHTTICGTVATWWYNSESGGATGASLRRSCTTSLGSICLGSLLVAIIQTLRAMAEQARGEQSCLACIAECILGCLQSMLEYFNRWAYVYVGIYGYKFSEAGKAVFELFRERGFDAIINDDLIGNVLTFGALAVGLICAGVGVAIGYTNIVDYQKAEIVLGVIGFVIGMGIALTPLSVIDSSIATIFVCFAEDPTAFLQAHPDLYHPLVREWHNLYPEVMVACGYWRADQV